MWVFAGLCPTQWVWKCEGYNRSQPVLLRGGWLFADHVYEVYGLLRHCQGWTFLLWLIDRVTFQAHTLCPDSLGFPRTASWAGRIIRLVRAADYALLGWSVQLFGPCAKALFGLGQLGEESVLKGNVSCCGLMALQTINVLEHYATVWDWSLLLPRDPVSSPPVSRGRRWQTMLWCCSMIHRGELKSKPNQKKKAGWCFSELCPQIVVGKGLPLRPQSMSLIQMSSWNAACIPAFDLGAQDYGSVIRPLQQAEEFMRSRLYFISPWFTEGDSCK